MSTNKTANYNLHAWVPGDDFLRAEFNENFAVLDAALGALAADAPAAKKLRVVIGSYMGDGTKDRPISLGFRPKAVVIGPRLLSGSAHTVICVDGVENDYVSVTDDGFTVTELFNYLYNHSFGSINGADLSPFTYIAFGWAE